MIIRTQDETAIYDFDKLVSVYAHEEEDGTCKIYVLSYSGEIAYPLGEYKRVERGKEIVAEIFALCDAQHRYDMPIV